MLNTIFGLPSARTANSIAARSSSGDVLQSNRIANRPTRAQMHKAKLSDAVDAVPSMDSDDGEVNAPPITAAPFVAPVTEVGQTRFAVRPWPAFGTHHLTSVCALGVCAQTACCCSSLRSTRPRRGWKLLSIGLEHALPRGASWALRRRRYSTRPMHSVCCSRRSMAALAVLERCVTAVSIREGDYWCLVDGCGASTARGTGGKRCGACRGMFLHSYAKT